MGDAKSLLQAQEYLGVFDTPRKKQWYRLGWRIPCCRLTHIQLLDASLMEESDFKNVRLGCPRLTDSFAGKPGRSGLKLAIKCLHDVLNYEHARSGWTLHEVTAE
jgi:hypothetical protein